MFSNNNFIKATEQYNTFEKNVPAYYFRRTFHSDHSAIAKITVAVCGFYEIYFNGKNITKGFLSPLYQQYKRLHLLRWIWSSAWCGWKCVWHFAWKWLPKQSRWIYLGFWQGVFQKRSYVFLICYSGRKCFTLQRRKL